MSQETSQEESSWQELQETSQEESSWWELQETSQEESSWWEWEEMSQEESSWQEWKETSRQTKELSQAIGYVTDRTSAPVLLTCTYCTRPIHVGLVGKPHA